VENSINGCGSGRLAGLLPSASSTHDTKRSEDVRARINVLSGAAEWKLNEPMESLNRQHFKKNEGGCPIAMTVSLSNARRCLATEAMADDAYNSPSAFSDTCKRPCTGQDPYQLDQPEPRLRHGADVRRRRAGADAVESLSRIFCLSGTRGTLRSPTPEPIGLEISAPGVPDFY
jgi:hypothetical protein